MDHKTPLLQTDGDGQPRAPPNVPGGKYVACLLINVLINVLINALINALINVLINALINALINVLINVPGGK